MKKYIFEATKRQWEKPTEPKQLFVADAQVAVCAESEDEAMEKAARKLDHKYKGKGTVLGKIRLIKTYDLAETWNCTDQAALCQAAIIK